MAAHGRDGGGAALGLRLKKNNEPPTRVLHVSNAGRGKTAKASKGKAGGFVTNRSGAPKGRVGKKV